LIAPALARRDSFADQRLRQRHQAAAAETLQHPCRRQEFDARSQCAEDRPDDEQRERSKHHTAAAEGIAETAIDRRGDGVGDEIGHHHPRHALNLAKVGGNGRKRRGNNRLVGDRQEHRQHDRRKNGQKQRAGGFRLAGVCRSLCRRRGFGAGTISGSIFIHRMCRADDSRA
jgi:hypothetical protein